MQANDAFAAVGTTEKVASSLYRWIAGNRGLKRTVVMELRENIELIRLYVECGAEAKELIPKISDDAFRRALAEGLNFNSFKRSKIGPGSTKNKPVLKKYHGWETQRVFENVYQKVSTLKQAIAITNARKPIRIGVRLNNVFELMVLLAVHIGD